MAVIGGIYDINGGFPDANVMTHMSKAMLLRGGYGRGGYIDRGIGLFSGRERIGVGEDARFFAFAERDGKNIIAVSDGDERAREIELWDSYGSESANYTERLIEKYMSYGVRLGEGLEGEFSLALYDGGRGELLLLRDRRGSRPLFYAKDRERIAFASEIKGVARFLGEPLAVDTERLRNHFFSPIPQCGGKIYRDIFEVSPSGGCICSSFGINSFGYVPSPCERPPTNLPYIVESEETCPDISELERMLTEILFAFDYPQFDFLMPSFISSLKIAKEGIATGRVAVSDGMMYTDLAYATERRDRLCAWYGAYAECVPSKYEIKERETKQLEKNLKKLLSGIDMSVNYRLFGENVLDLVLKEKSVSKRIRMEGMLYQIPTWYKSYNIVFA